ncbi:Mannose-6-phosphate isomerase, cupin superfamily [Alteribacillus persepolensis]|uniref:Mannose-6-phosphate isomerase, cupin superfamily n=1 Tax=Alteribacillus persepolensis TaxID=568899 RepID=A0A1G8B3Q0_9BACI|nr:cupin domain-containing protein [Alteribacillus persepolensis]SDH27882.1 Mannose-6-phosphate isomerase, cupin superfamily [Alteribacillus persepolensis]
MYYVPPMFPYMPYGYASRYYPAPEYWHDRQMPPQQMAYPEAFINPYMNEAAPAKRSENAPPYNNNYNNEHISLQDYGSQPFVVNIEEATTQNNTFRTALWTGEHLQVTVMSIDVGDDIGLEIHPDVDQFLRIEQGQGLVQMGETQDQLPFETRVRDDDAIMVPAGMWHNLTNIGNVPLKLYTIYAPPEHPYGTVHQTKADALAAEED